MSCDHKKRENEKMCLRIVFVYECIIERDGGRNRERKGEEREKVLSIFCTQMKIKNMNCFKGRKDSSEALACLYKELTSCSVVDCG